MVGGEFTVYVIALRFGFAMHVLIARTPRDRCHGHHPEVVGIGAQRMQGLLESDLDFEPVTVTGDQLQGAERQIRAHHNQAPARRMLDQDKAHQLSHGSPEQIERK
jgi:hypothetical protein